MRINQSRFFSLFSIFILLFFQFSFSITYTVNGESDAGSYRINGHINVGKVNDLVFFPDNIHIAIASNPLPIIIDTNSMIISQSLSGQKGIILTVDVSSDYIVTGSEDGSIFFWNYSGQKQQELSLHDKIIKLRFDKTERKLAVLTANSSIHLFSLNNFQSIWHTKIEGVNEDFQEMEWSPNNTFISIINKAPEEYVIFLNSSSGEEAFRLYDGIPSIKLLSFTWGSDPNSFSIIVQQNVYLSNYIDIWDLTNLTRINQFFGYLTWISDICWIPETHLIAGVSHNTTYIWKDEYAENQRILIEGTDLKYITANQIGKTIAVSSANTGELFILIWDEINISNRPSVIISHPAPDANAEETLVVDGIAFGLREITEVRVRIGNSEWTRAIGTNNWKITLDISNYNPGAYDITAISFDDYLFSEPAQIRIHILKKTSDYNSNVYFTNPKDQSTGRGVIRINGIFSNDQYPNPTIIQISIDSQEWFDINASNVWFYNWNSSTYINGKHIIFARGYDGHKWSKIASLVIYINNPNPPIIDQHIFIDYPSESQEVSGSFEIKGRTVFPIGQIENEIQLNKNGIWFKVNGTSNWTFPFNSTQFVDGPFQIDVRGSNGINETEYIRRFFIIRNNNSHTNKPPFVIINEPKEGQRLKILEKIKGTASDDLTIEYIEIKIDNGPWIRANGQETWEYQIPPSKKLNNSNHIINARAFDGELYSGIYSVSININDTEPIDPDVPLTLLDSPYFCLYIFIGMIIILMLFVVYIFKRINRENLDTKHLQKRGRMDNVRRAKDHVNLRKGNRRS